MGHIGHGFQILIWPKVELKETRTAVKWETKVEKRCEKNCYITKNYKMFSQAKMTNSSAYGKWTR